MRTGYWHVHIDTEINDVATTTSNTEGPGTIIDVLRGLLEDAQASGDGTPGMVITGVRITPTEM